MSVNTPKRLKTTPDPFKSVVDLCYIPNNILLGDQTGWSYPPSTDVQPPGHDPALYNAVLSPNSSCGSPETTAVAPTTPSKTKDHAAIQFPTPTTTSMPEGLLQMNSNSGGRRGRPRSESLTNLMIAGSTSPSSIKCKFCNRVFPREKSLAAHLRTHTGERPYVCDYPGCTKSFTQSGQMKTHQRLHTGERPFICAAPSCEMRFTHANRHCPVHVNGQLKRDDKFVVKMTPEQNDEVLSWLEKYRAEREDKSTPTRKTPQRGQHGASRTSGSGAATSTTTTTTESSGKVIAGPTTINPSTQKENLPHTPIQDRSASSSSPLSSSSNGYLYHHHNHHYHLHNHHHQQQMDGPSLENNCSERENSLGSSSGTKQRPPNDENECPVTPSTPSNGNPYKSRKGLMVELDMNAGLASSPLAPLKMKPQPKLIQWEKEPLSQGEEDEDEDDEEEENELHNGCRGNGGSKYYQNGENVSPRKTSLSQNYYNHQQQQHQQNPNPRTPQKKENLLLQSPRKFSPSKKALKQNTSTFNPKKKWLREACMEDLAKPLDGSGSLGSPQKLQIKSMNLLRPTVLMLASKDKPVPLLGTNGDGLRGGGGEAANEVDNRRKWMGKMAMMQLATTTTTEQQNRSQMRAEVAARLDPEVTSTNGLGVGLPEYTQL